MGKAERAGNVQQVRQRGHARRRSRQSRACKAGGTRVKLRHLPDRLFKGGRYLHCTSAHIRLKA